MTFPLSIGINPEIFVPAKSDNSFFLLVKIDIRPFQLMYILKYIIGFKKDHDSQFLALYTIHPTIFFDVVGGIEIAP